MPALEGSPYSLVEALAGLDFFLGKPTRLVIAGSADREAFLQAAWSGYRRNLLVLGNEGPVGAFTRALAPVDGKTTAYYCEGQTCRAPETDLAKVAAWLGEARP